MLRQPGEPSPLVGPQGRLEAGGLGQLASGVEALETIGEGGEGAVEADRDGLTGDRQLSRERGGQPIGRPQPWLTAQPRQQLGIGQHPPTPEANERALGIGQDRELVGRQDLVADRHLPPELEQRVHGEGGGGHRRRSRAAEAGAQLGRGPRAPWATARRCRRPPARRPRRRAARWPRRRRVAAGWASPRRAGAAAGGHTLAPRRRARSSSASAASPKRAITRAGATQRSAASITRLGSTALVSWSTAANPPSAPSGSSSRRLGRAVVPAIGAATSASHGSSAPTSWRSLPA